MPHAPEHADEQQVTFGILLTQKKPPPGANREGVFRIHTAYRCSLF
nr:MAG TPA: hypothetical protein [Caudoviricetes sp.]